MTVLDDRQLTDWAAMCARPVVGSRLPVPHRRPVSRRRPVADRPGPARPAVAPLRYQGYGVRMSQVAHTRRPVSTALSIGLAGLAALVTLWLGFLAHFSADRVAAPSRLPDRLAVVQVQAGETLQQLADRVAPQTPTGQVIERIRELNKLDSVSVDAGQTLIAPVG